MAAPKGKNEAQVIAIGFEVKSQSSGVVIGSIENGASMLAADRFCSHFGTILRKRLKFTS